MAETCIWKSCEETGKDAYIGNFLNILIIIGVLNILLALSVDSYLLKIHFHLCV